jgi:hypothetical protein
MSFLLGSSLNARDFLIIWFLLFCACAVQEIEEQ